MHWTPLHTKLHRTLRSRQLLSRNQRLLIAVSGGQDSLCLAKLLLDLQPKWGWELAIAHCDHRWRSDSSANANYVAQLAQNWQIPFYLQTANQVCNSEAQARQWRYQALSAIAHQHNYPYILTGHTASDRAETLLYNLIRGSGADGLQALTWQRFLEQFEIFLIRPLLEITRSETAQFCQDQQLTIWEDTTNQNLQYARNRIRQELIPYLQTQFNPQVEQHLAQTAELLRADVEYLEQEANNLLQLAVEEIGRKLTNNNHLLPCKIDRLILSRASLALQRRVMRQLLQLVLPCTPSFEHIEKLTALITAPNRSCSDPFPGGAIAQVEGKFIYVTCSPSQGG